MSSAEVRDPTGGADGARQELATTLPGERFTSTEWHELDLARVFRRSWLYAGHVCDLREPGSFITFSLDHDCVIIVRDSDQTLSAFHNVCRHRGSQIVDEPKGQVKKAFVCPYHGWSYSLSGELRTAPRMPEGFDASDHALKNVWVDEWNGFVFVNLSERRPTQLADELAGADIAAYRLDHAKVVQSTREVWACNWKIVMANALECYHCGMNHPELVSIVDVHSPGEFEPEDLTDSLSFHRAFPMQGDAKTQTMSGEFASKRLLGDPGTPLSDTFSIDWMPATQIMAGPDHGLVFSWKPLSATSCEYRTDWLVHADAEEGSDYVPEDLTSLWTATNHQDRAICERVQRGVSSSAYVPGEYNPAWETEPRRALDFYLRLSAA